jgi:hypothetical protein
VRLLKIADTKKVAQVVECLPNKCKAPSSNPSITRERERKKEREREREIVQKVICQSMLELQRQTQLKVIIYLASMYCVNPFS